MNYAADYIKNKISSLLLYFFLILVVNATYAEDYCSTTGQLEYEYIKNISINGFSNETGDSDYGDYTDTVIPLDLGGNQISLTPGFTENSWDEYWKIWIDLDGSGSFESNEMVVNNLNGNGQVSADINIASIPLVSSTRMRIAMKYASEASSACGNIGDGEVEDYTVSFPGRSFSCDKNLEPDGSGQHQWGSSYADWHNQDWGIRFEQNISLEQVAPNSFHTNTFALTYASGGYIGLQTHGIDSDGALTTNARFSIWNTLDAQGDECSSFGGEGVGKTCVINPLPLYLGIEYTLRVERLSIESDGTWWQGSVIDQSNGAVHIIGKIKVEHSEDTRLVRPGGNFTEYFGPKAVDCQSVPQSIVNWQAPNVTGDNDNTISSAWRSFSKANPSAPCSEAGVEAQGEIINRNGKTFYRMTNGSIPMCWSVNSEAN